MALAFAFGSRPTRRCRLAVGAVVVCVWASGMAMADGRETAPAACTPRLLVLSAFPAEIDPLLSEAELDGGAVAVDGRRFYVGTLRGLDVVLALTGIGMVNAENVTQAAFQHFGCGDGGGIIGVVFSGVAGGGSIGDVAVPARWTEDGTTWFPVDGPMLAVARTVVESDSVTLTRDASLGDPACLCVDVGLAPVRLPRQPEIVVGGDGLSSDPFGGRAFPCVPAGGDVFGCQPCRDQDRGDELPVDLGRLVTGVLPFVDAAFIVSFLQAPPVADPTYAAQDIETAATARVATEHGTPFIAFRGVSDGGGDPLMLPGFPLQFFVYRRVAADNAAAMTLAFVEAWGREHVDPGSG